MSNDPPLITLRYRLLATLGEGSMGAVYHAHDRLTGRDVALKRVTIESTDATTDEEVRALRLALAHEVRTLAGLRHPHIISALDYGFDMEVGLSLARLFACGSLVLFLILLVKFGAIALNFTNRH